MQSLKSITLDYLSKNLSEDLLDELGKKVLNKYYTSDGEIIDVIWNIDDEAIYNETGDHLIYWLWKYVPRYVMYTKSDHYDVFHGLFARAIEKNGKNETIYLDTNKYLGLPRLLIQGQKTMVYKIEFSVDKIHKLTKELFKQLPIEVLEHITTKQIPIYSMVEAGRRLYPTEPLSNYPSSRKNNEPKPITEWYGLLG